MEQKAKDLAQELLDSNQDTFVTSFSIKQNNEVTSEEIVVIVKRIKKSIVHNFKEAMKRYIPSASGNQCPTCRGTGRI